MVTIVLKIICINAILHISQPNHNVVKNVRIEAISIVLVLKKLMGMKIAKMVKLVFIKANIL